MPADGTRFNFTWESLSVTVMQAQQAPPDEGQSLENTRGAESVLPAPASPRSRTARSVGAALPLPRSARATFLAVLALIAFLLLSGNRAATLYTDWLWARSIGYGDLWQRLYGARLVLFTAFGVASFVLAYLNVRLADYFSPSALVSVPIVPPGPAPARRSGVLLGITGGFGDGPPLSRTLQWVASLRPLLDRLLLVGALAFAVAAGLSAQAQWNSFLRFTHPVVWGQTDPLFGRDIGYYVFALPWLRYVQGWLLTVFLLIGAGVTVVYLYQQGVNWIAEHHARVHARTSGAALAAHQVLQPIPPTVRAHLSGLLFLVLAAKGWGYYLDRFDLMYDTSGWWLPGAGYTDVHVRLPMLNVAIGVIGIAALAALINVRRRGFGLPALSLVLWLGFSGLGVISPGAVQRLLVQPNEAELEAPYLARAIAATRTGYGLDHIEIRSLETARPSADNAASDTALWSNVPLWQPRHLLARWGQDVPLPPYERINTVHLDRYLVRERADGPLGMRVVAVGTHEITREHLQGTALTWLNRHLSYTHGQGVTASLAGENTADTNIDDLARAGVPRLLTSVTAPGLIMPDVSAPAIYFGTADPDTEYALLPSPGTNEERVGLPLPTLTRAALAARFTTWSLLLSGAIKPDTRLLLLRSVSEQVKRVAPFLLLDPTPHPVVSGGRVWWIVPAYTSSSAYPNALVTQLGDDWGPVVQANYVRASVLAVVDAATGQVTLYAADSKAETDPLLRSYQRCFPNAILPSAALPADLRAHRRYPLGLMTLQRQVLGLYHTTDANTFYSHAATWEPSRGSRAEPDEAADALIRSSTSFLAPLTALTDAADYTPPRYGFAEIDANHPEFVLQSPLITRGMGRVAGVLVGRCDGASYGQLQLYQAPGAATSALLAPDLMARHFDEAASLGQLLGKQQSPLVSAPTGAASFTSGTARMVLRNGRVYYLQPVRVTGTSLPTVDNTPPPSDTPDEAADVFKPLPRLWRVRVGDGQRMAEGATIKAALNALQKEKR